MGYTTFSVSKLEQLIKKYNVKSVVDLGAQNMYNQPVLPAPYARGWYNEQGIKYVSIDINGEDGAMPIDLSLPQTNYAACDMIVDAGTSEHVGNERSEFSWEAIYNCWKTKFDLLKIGGVMYSENPKTGNWPGHGRQYYTEQFYTLLDSISGLDILEIGTHAAMNNTTDGWNVFCSMEKTGDKFPTLAQFKKLDLRYV